MTRGLALLLLAVVPLVPFTQSRIEERLGRYRAQQEVLYLWSGDQVRNLVPGFEGLAADLYWLRTVQYYGGRKAFTGEGQFELLEPLIDITTALDPRLEIAYRYGAVFLCEHPPNGAGRPREGIEVLERGVQHLPESWRLRQDLGFFYFLYLDDARRAAEVLQEAAELPGAAFWLHMLAADLLERGGERESSRQMWQQMYEQAEKGILKDNARLQLEIIDSRALADELSGRVTAFEQRQGRRPASLRELQVAGLWPGPLVDLGGVPFSYDEKSGGVSVARESPMWRPEPDRRRRE